MDNFNWMNLNDLLNGIFGYAPDYRKQTARPSISQATSPTSPAPTVDNPLHNATDAFNLANEIKRKKEQIALEQAELEEAQRKYEEQLKKIRYVADDEKIEMLIPREKMVKLIKGLTDAINNNPTAKSYKVTINL
jgi:hypothetical protein